jgi:shikimate kinase
MNALHTDRFERMYITGFMGSGKSTIGPLLAASLRYQYIDLDVVIEANEVKSISEIFRERGEAGFRALERRELGNISTRSGVVVATGGGALTDPGSLTIVRESGVLVYLEVQPGILITRLRGRTGRPMITAADGTPLEDDQLRERISSLLRIREPLYRRADIIVDSGSQSPPETVSDILKSLASLRTSS